MNSTLDAVTRNTSTKSAIDVASAAVADEAESLSSRSSISGPSLSGKRVGMVLFSTYPYDPRPRRAVEALLKEGVTVDLVCLAEEGAPRHETLERLRISRVAITQERGGKFSYAYRYSAFILVSAVILALRSLRRRYDLIYVHNMPDILVLSAMIPKALGAKVILDLHDPMPELATTIFGLAPASLGIRVIKKLEQWSLAQADLVLTVNLACKRIFGSRSCPPDKIGVVMNSPDEDIFPMRAPRSYTRSNRASGRSFVIMYHGSLVARNGADLAVEALALVRESVPSAELRIYGRETPFLKEVLDLAHRKGVEARVRYLGPRSLEELVGDIEECDVGIIPNQSNAFTDINTPTRIFEYLAMGKPVIAPRTPGILDYFTGDSLLLFESGNVADIARQIEYAAHNHPEAVKIAERGQHVYLQHTWQQERKTLIDLTKKLLETAEA
jgi:glycosyltransferase involved in cell wall biosynthesis